MKISKLFAKLAMLVLAAAGLSSCYIRISDKAVARLKEQIVIGSETTATKTFHPDSYRNLDIRNDWDKEFVQTEGDSVRVEITTSDNLLDRVRVVTLRDMLVIAYEGDFPRIHASEHKVVVYGPLPDTLRLSGSGNATLQNLWGDALYISLSGSGDLDAEDVAVGDFRLVSQGSGDATIGRLHAGVSCSIDRFGSGDLRITGLKSPGFSLRMSGSGDARLTGEVEQARFSRNGSGSLDAAELFAESVEIERNTGSGSLVYRRNGETVDADKD